MLSLSFCLGLQAADFGAVRTAAVGSRSGSSGGRMSGHVRPGPEGCLRVSRTESCIQGTYLDLATQSDLHVLVLTLYGLLTVVRRQSVNAVDSEYRCLCPPALSELLQGHTYTSISKEVDSRASLLSDFHSSPLSDCFQRLQ